jgi:hypothetical protein
MWSPVVAAVLVLVELVVARTFKVWFVDVWSDVYVEVADVVVV